MQPRDIGIILLIGLIVACLVSTVPFVSEQSYGEINAKDTIIVITDPDTYYPLTDSNAGLLNGFTFEDGNLTADYNGVYLIVSQWSFSGSTNNEYHLSLNINGVQESKCHAERQMESGDVGSASYTCLVTLNTGDNITPIIENITSGNNATIHDFELTIHNVGSSPTR